MRQYSLPVLAKERRHFFKLNILTRRLIFRRVGSFTWKLLPLPSEKFTALGQRFALKNLKRGATLLNFGWSNPKWLLLICGTTWSSLSNLLSTWFSARLPIVLKN